MLSRSDSYSIGYLIIGILILILPFMNLIPVSIMEARDFVTAREMITDGNWFLTTFNGEPRYEKPPLPTWFAAIFGKLLGKNSTMGMRLPSILMFTLCTFLIGFMGKCLGLGKRQFYLGSLVFCSSLYSLMICFEAPWDIFTHTFMLMALCFLFQSFQTKKIKRKQVLWIILGFSASILSKGPVSFYVLFLSFLLAYIFVYQPKWNGKKVLKYVGIIIISILIGGAWYWYVRHEDPLSFAKIADKETSNWTGYNTRPFYYYWSFFTQSGMWSIMGLVSLAYPFMKKRVKNLRQYRFTLFWTLIAVILLSIIPEKKSRYLMPVLIPLALNISFYLEFLIGKVRLSLSKEDRILVGLNFGLLSFFGIVIPLFTLGYCYWEGYEVSFMLWLICIVLIASGISMLSYLRKWELDKVFSRSVFIYSLVLILFFVSYFQVMPHPSYAPVETLGKENESQQIRAYCVDTVPPEIIWQYGAQIPYLVKDEILELPPEDQFGLFAYPFNDEILEEFKKNYLVQEKQKYNLNLMSDTENGFRERLAMTYFILTKK